MASSTGYDTGIRQSLLSKGISNSDIGYNSNNGYVTVKGQDFLKPAKVLNGASYDTAQNFNNAWNSYNKSIPTVGASAGGITGSTYTPKATTTQTAPAGSVGIRNSLQSSGYNPSSIGYNNGAVTLNNQPFMQPTYNVGGTAYATPNAYNSALSNYRIGDLTNQIVNNTKLPENQYTQQINDQISYLMNMAKNPQTIDPYSTPEYAAYAAQAQKSAGQNIRAAQESLGSSGFGRSTMLADRAQGIQNDATEYLNTQVVPQIIAANQAKQQQEFSNLMNLLNPLMSQQGYADTRAQTELGNTTNALNLLTTEQQRGLDNSRADAALTGNYLTEDQRNTINALLSLKSQAEAKGTTAAQRSVLSTQADQLRSRLQALGIDPSLYGSNVSLAQAGKAQPGRTIAGQQLDLSAQNQKFNQNLDTRKQNTSEKQYSEQFAYQKARDAITDKQWQAKFDYDQKQGGLDYALRKLSEENQTAYQQAQLGLSQDDNARAWAQLDYEQSQPGSTKSSGLTPSQVLESVKSMYSEPIYNGTEYDANGNEVPKDTGKTKVTTDSAKRKEMFETVIDYGLSDAETNQILLSLGMSKKEIDSLLKSYSGN
ncbi:hypothetical protein D3C75_442880 [compost metagenome]